MASEEKRNDPLAQTQSLFFDFMMQGRLSQDGYKIAGKLADTVGEILSTPGINADRKSELVPDLYTIEVAAAEVEDMYTEFMEKTSPRLAEDNRFALTCCKAVFRAATTYLEVGREKYRDTMGDDLELLLMEENM